MGEVIRASCSITNKEVYTSMARVKSVSNEFLLGKEKRESNDSHKVRDRPIPSYGVLKWSLLGRKQELRVGCTQN